MCQITVVLLLIHIADRDRHPSTYVASALSMRTVYLNVIENFQPWELYWFIGWKSYSAAECTACYQDTMHETLAH